MEMMQPQVVTDVLLAYPADVSHLMPPEDKIPEEYWGSDDSWPCLLFRDMFFNGVKGLSLVPREGIDPSIAFRHIRAIMGTFSCQHEYKEAACRYLFDQWFVNASWRKAK